MTRLRERIESLGWRPFIIAVRCALAALLAVETCRACGLTHPLYALVAAILVTEFHGAETRKQSVTRFIGNALGIVAGGVLGTFFGSHGVVIGFAAFAMVLFCYYLGFEATAKLSAFVAALTVMEHSSTPWVYGRDRIVETLIGIAAAVLMSVVIRVPHRTAPAPILKPAGE